MQRALFTSLVNSTWFIPTAMVAGDFWGIGRDILVTAVGTSSNLYDNRIYMSDIARGDSVIAGRLSPQGEAPTYNQNTKVTAMAAGYFHEDTDGLRRQQLVTATTNQSKNFNVVTLVYPDYYSNDGNPINYSKMITTNTYAYVSNFAVGDFNADGFDELVTAWINDQYNDNMIHRNTPNYGGGPGNAAWGNNRIWQGNKKVTAMIAGKFVSGLTKGFSSGKTNNEKKVDSQISLSNNYPNPFNPTTIIEFTIPENGKVRIEVFNALGQRVAILANSFYQAGTHSVQFDGSSLSSGLYIYRLNMDGVTITRTMTLVK